MPESTEQRPRPEIEISEAETPTTSTESSTAGPSTSEPPGPEEPATGTPRWVVRLLVVLLALLLAGAGAGLYLRHQVQLFLTTSPDPAGEGERVVVEILPGTRFTKIAQELEKQGVVTSARNFRWLAKFREQDGSIKAGEFTLATDMLPDAVLDALVEGSQTLYRLTLPEGLTWWQTAQAIEDQGAGNATVFSDLVRDPAFLAAYGIPFETAEGFLFPETYMLPRYRKELEKRVADLLVRTCLTTLDRIDPEIRQDEDRLKQVVILASLVERETNVDEERARVAGVYQNRLNRKMRLQADPTVIYGLGQSFDGNLRRRDLRNADNPYNTYTQKGLPPGPISSPGQASLEAAVTPEEHDFLYFVAKGDGSGAHTFSKTLKEHNKAVRAYLREIRK